MMLVSLEVGFPHELLDLPRCLVLPSLAVCSPTKQISLFHCFTNYPPTKQISFCFIVSQIISFLLPSRSFCFIFSQIISFQGFLSSYQADIILFHKFTNYFFSGFSAASKDSCPSLQRGPRGVCFLEQSVKYCPISQEGGWGVGGLMKGSTKRENIARLPQDVVLWAQDKWK